MHVNHVINQQIQILKEDKLNVSVNQVNKKNFLRIFSKNSILGLYNATRYNREGQCLQCPDGGICEEGIISGTQKGKENSWKFH